MELRRKTLRFYGDVLFRGLFLRYVRLVLPPIGDYLGVFRQMTILFIVYFVDRPTAGWLRWRTPNPNMP